MPPHVDEIACLPSGSVLTDLMRVPVNFSCGDLLALRCFVFLEQRRVNEQAVRLAVSDSEHCMAEPHLLNILSEVSGKVCEVNRQHAVLPVHGWRRGIDGPHDEMKGCRFF